MSATKRNSDEISLRVHFLLLLAVVLFAIVLVGWRTTMPRIQRMAPRTASTVTLNSLSPTSPSGEPSKGETKSTQSWTTSTIGLGDDPSNWPAYESRYAFSFRYPPHWTLEIPKSVDIASGGLGPLGLETLLLSCPIYDSRVCPSHILIMSVTTATLGTILEEEKKSLTPIIASTVTDYTIEVDRPMHGFMFTLPSDIGGLSIHYYLDLPDGSKLYVSYRDDTYWDRAFEAIINTVSSTAP